MHDLWSDIVFQFNKETISKLSHLILLNPNLNVTPLYCGNIFHIKLNQGLKTRLD